MTVDVAVSNAYSKGGIPLTIAGVANLKVAGHRPLLANALERLPGRRRPQIIQVAKATLERNLRGVLSRLTPEQVKAAFGVDLAKVVGRLGAPEEKG